MVRGRAVAVGCGVTVTGTSTVTSHGVCVGSGVRVSRGVGQIVAVGPGQEIRYSYSA